MSVGSIRSIGISGMWVDATTGVPVTTSFFADGIVRGTFSTTDTDKFFADADCKTWLLEQSTSQDT